MEVVIQGEFDVSSATNDIWHDFNGRQREGKEPNQRTGIRFRIQASGDEVERKFYTEKLNEFDRNWP